VALAVVVGVADVEGVSVGSRVGVGDGEGDTGAAPYQAIRTGCQPSDR
jgi:hypothetical protein